MVSNLPPPPEGYQRPPPPGAGYQQPAGAGWDPPSPGPPGPAGSGGSSKTPWIVLASCGGLFALLLVGGCVAALVAGPPEDDAAEGRRGDTEEPADDEPVETTTTTEPTTTEPPETTPPPPPPATAPPLSEEEIREAAFVVLMQVQVPGLAGASHDEIVELGHLVCDGIDESGDVTTFATGVTVLLLTDPNAFGGATPEDMGYVIGGSVEAFCPEWSESLEEFSNSFG